jgi:hypothetical protein
VFIPGYYLALVCRHQEAKKPESLSGTVARRK